MSSMWMMFQREAAEIAPTQNLQPSAQVFLSAAVPRPRTRLAGLLMMARGISLADVEAQNWSRLLLLVPPPPQAGG